jgi:signal transduction histidine kinase
VKHGSGHGDTREPRTPASDITVVRRAGRVAAIQASLALAGVLLVVGAVVFTVYVRVQNRQISEQLQSVAATADDVGDPPPGMTLVMRDLDGNIAVGDKATDAVDLLSGPTGFTDAQLEGQHYRAFVLDKPEGRVVALLDLVPYQDGRSRLLLALGFAELAGILASIAVVALFTRRSVRPLSQALALQRRFVADASHELRAPLTVLHTRAQLLGRRVDSGDVAAVKEHIDALIDDTRALGDIVEDLLASASMTGRAAPREPVDMSAVAKSVHTSMSSHAESLGVTLAFDYQAPSATTGFDVLGSQTALRRALTSLVDNALSHEHDGGTVVLRVRRDGEKVAVDVQDDGVGIDPEAMKTLFTRFSHGATHTTNARREPYGIGLALVREIAQAHDGDIAVTQTPGGGATFTLTVPAAGAT